MNKAGRVILIVVLAAVLLGAVCVGVGLMTGGDVEDILLSLNSRYNLEGYWSAYSQWAVTAYHNIAEGLRLW